MQHLNNKEAMASLQKLLSQQKEKSIPSKAELESLWVFYDEDKSGTLEETECLHLLQDLCNVMLKENRKELDAMEPNPMTTMFKNLLKLR